MYQQSDADQEKLFNVGADVIKKGVKLTAEIALISRHQAVEVEIKTAADDVKKVRQGLKTGVSRKEIAQSLLKSEVAQRIAKAGGNVKEYAMTILQKAEIENATEMMPSTSLKKVKTRRKTL